MSALDGLHPLMRRRVEALLADPAARDRGVHVVSGFRSVERQAQLYAGAVENCRRNPAKCPPSRWVARPGTSNHGPRSAALLRSKGYTAAEVAGQGGGIAVDFGIRGVRANSAGQWPPEVDTWFQQLAGRHGLEKRLPWEDWHYEPKRGWTAPDEEDDLTPDQARQLNALYEVIVEGKTSPERGALLGGINHQTTQATKRGEPRLDTLAGRVAAVEKRTRPKPAAKKGRG